MGAGAHSQFAQDCDTIYSRIDDSDWNAAVELGPMVACLFAGLRRHASSVQATLAAARLLARLYQPDAMKASEFNVGRDGVEALVAALRALSGGAHDLASIMAVLSRCASAAEATAAWAVEAGGVEAAVAAMLAHPMDHVVQNNGCSFLPIIAISLPSSGRAVVVAAGALELIAAAMKAFPGETCLQQNGGRALTILLR